MRRKPAVSHESHERWLVSYADFITLLFAFFVVMFASTQTDKSKAKAVSESVKDALEHGQFSSTLSTVLGRGKHENSKPPTNPERVKTSENLPPQTAPPPQPVRPPPADLAKSLQTLQRGLDGELKANKIGLQLEGRGLVISLREATFFASGDDAVAPGSEAILAKIAAESKASATLFVWRVIPIRSPFTIRAFAAIGSCRWRAASPCWSCCGRNSASRPRGCR